MLDLISDYCSILGFAISILTFGYAFFIEKKVREFRKNVLFNTRVPDLAKNLKYYNSQLSRDLNEKNERAIKETINLCKAVIGDINSKLPRDLNKQGTKIKKVFRKQHKSDFQLTDKKSPTWKFWISVTTLDDLWDTYSDLNAWITRIDNLVKDKKIV